MALEAGTMAVTVEFAKDLKDTDWFGKQDPYCIVKCGSQTYRTKTAIDGGKNPVWNETFTFNVINENSIELELKDEDVGKDDRLGLATVSLAKAREQGSDRMQVPVIRKNSKKQQGFVSIAVKWTPNRSLHAQQQPGAHHPPPMYAHAPPPGTYYPPQQAFYAPPPQPYPPQPYPGQPYPGQPYPGQAYPGQPYPAAQPYPPPGGQPYPGQPYPGQGYPPQGHGH